MFSATRATSSPSVVSGRMLQAFGRGAAIPATPLAGAAPFGGSGFVVLSVLAVLSVFGVLAMAISLPSVRASLFWSSRIKSPALRRFRWRESPRPTRGSP